MQWLEPGMPLPSSCLQRMLLGGGVGMLGGWSLARGGGSPGAGPWGCYSCPLPVLFSDPDWFVMWTSWATVNWTCWSVLHYHDRPNLWNPEPKQLPSEVVSVGYFGCSDSTLSTADKHTLMCCHHRDLKTSKKAPYQLSCNSHVSPFLLSWVSTNLSSVSVDLPILHTSSKCNSMFRIYVFFCVSLFKL